MNTSRSFLFVSTLLYSLTTLANENPFSYQADNNSFTLLESVHIKPSEIEAEASPSSYFHNSTNQPMSFLGNGFSLTIEQMGPSAEGPVFSSTDISFKNFSALNLLNCTQASNDEHFEASSGIMASSQTISFEQNAATQFLNNTSSRNGGALLANQALFDTISLLAFTGNATAVNGGAIYANKVAFSKHKQCAFNKNTANLSGGALFLKDNGSFERIYDAHFFENKALNGNGGALCSQSDILIQGNFQLRMQENQASSEQEFLGYGGAICCATTEPSSLGQTFDIAVNKPSAPILRIKDNFLTVFSNNTASASGGAIYCDNLHIENNSGTYFLHNRAKQGGAIAIADTGSISLHAGDGIIVFQGNQNITPAGPTVRNAIHLASKAHFSEISTLGGGNIFFYDPITQDDLPEGATARTLIINPKEESNPSGSVVFSGKHATSEERANPENISSVLHHHVHLNSGTLALEEGARLHVESFKQTDEAILRLQPDTELSAQKDIRVTNIEMSLNQLGSGQSARFISFESPSSVTVNGHITLNDSDKNFYENHAVLNHDEVALPLIQVHTSEDTSQTQTLILKGDLESTYGYQGNWDLIWKNDEQAGAQTLCALWTKTAYNPHPERLTKLVANSLWNTHADMFAISEALETKMLGEPHALGIWGTAVSSFFHKPADENNTPDALSNWHHRSCGYLLGANTHSQSGLIFGLAAGKLYGKSSDISSEQRDSYIVSAFSKISTPFIYVSANASYNRTSHSLATPYRAFHGEGSGSWDSECFAGDLCSALSFTLNENSRLLHSVALFAKAQVFDGKQPMFEEDSCEARQFSENHLRLLTVPVGINFEGRTKKHVMFYNVSLAYAQDVYKDVSENTATLKANGASWPTEMANFDKHALVFKIAHHRSLKQLQMFLNFSGTLRKDAQIYALNIGSSCKF